MAPPPAAGTLISLSPRRYLLLASIGASGYAAYLLYRSSAVRRLLRLSRSLLSAADFASDSAETLSLVSSDLRRFLVSDSDYVPASVRQISKLARSDEFSSAVARISEAVTVGFLRGYNRNSSGGVGVDVEVGSRNMADRVLDRVFSPAGSGFASVVVGSFARNMVLAYYSRDASSLSWDGVHGWVDTICGGKCRRLIADCIQQFVGTAVAVYLEKTMQINAYDELFSGMTNQRHETRVKDLLVSVFNGAVETLVRTSHQVLASSDSRPSGSTSKGLAESNANGLLGDGEGLNAGAQYKGLTKGKGRSFDEIQDSGRWIETVSSTLSVPSNRRFVLDVTGRVAFESVRSFLDFTVWRVSHGVRSGLSVVQRESLEKGMEVLRYASAKSVLIFTVCLALCLRLLTVNANFDAGLSSAGA